MLPELAERDEADLTLWLFFVLIFIDHFQTFILKYLLPTVKVMVFREALGPNIDVAILNESVMKVCALPTFDFLADPLLILESSCIMPTSLL